MAERFKAAVLKTVDGVTRPGGSNPSSSATFLVCWFPPSHCVELAILQLPACDTVRLMANTHSRRQFLGASITATASLAMASCSEPNLDPSARPNFLFVIADDWRFPHAGICGDKGVHTPAFDRIAREGVLFTHSFCASPSCTPSRSAVLAGRPIYNTGEAGVL